MSGSWALFLFSLGSLSLFLVFITGLVAGEEGPSFRITPLQSIDRVLFLYEFFSAHSLIIAVLPIKVVLLDTIQTRLVHRISHPFH
uniref:Uncharacterized protein n=1 Tax=Arundo donax TaxID=35708 RepID=A0A0A9GG36_ARUDO